MCVSLYTHSRPILCVTVSVFVCITVYSVFVCITVYTHICVSVCVSLTDSLYTHICVSVCVYHCIHTIYSECVCVCAPPRLQFFHLYF